MNIGLVYLEFKYLIYLNSLNIFFLWQFYLYSNLENKKYISISFEFYILSRFNDLQSGKSEQICISNRISRLKYPLINCPQTA